MDLKSFVATLDPVFLNHLLNITREEVYSIATDVELTADNKELLDTFFVQPLYWSKLNTLFTFRKIYSESSIDEIIKSDLSDEDKDQILSMLADKLDIQYPDADTRAKAIIEKIYYNDNQLIPALIEINKNEEIATSFINKSKHFYFSPYFYKFITLENFMSLVFAENIQLKNISNVIKNKTVFFDLIDEYKNMPNNINVPSYSVFLNKFERKSIAITGTGKTIVIEGYIRDFETDLKEEEYDIEYESKVYVGFCKSKITIKPREGVHGNIHYNEYIASEETFKDIESIQGYNTFIQAPYKIVVEYSLSKEDPNNRLQVLTQEVDYTTFFRLLKSLASSLIKDNIMFSTFRAKLYINPFAYIEAPVSIDGINFNATKLLQSLSNEYFLVSLKKA